jgi:MarR family transcriptional regulator, lower aerobic nicotinate degradation pathway regulator
MTTTRAAANGATTPTELSTLLAGLGREATARVRRAIRPFGLGAQEYLVLSQLGELGHTSQVELAAALGLDPSNLASTAGELVDRGLVDRCRDNADRRRYALSITVAGAELSARAAKAIRETEHELLAALDGDQVSQLRGLLRQVADRIDLCPAADTPGCSE